VKRQFAIDRAPYGQLIRHSRSPCSSSLSVTILAAQLNPRRSLGLTQGHMYLPQLNAFTGTVLNFRKHAVHMPRPKGLKGSEA
jgi:hypothetical protein